VGEVKNGGSYQSAAAAVAAVRSNADDDDIDYSQHNPITPPPHATANHPPLPPN